MRNTSDPIKENSNVMNAQGGEKKVMKKILSVALSTAMAFSMFASVAFGDTAVSAQQQFDALKAKGIFSGYPDGTAGLNKEMTRAEFAKVITKLLGLKEITGVFSYNDKNYNAKNWAAPYIEAVTAAGIMEGKNVEKKIFDFNGKVTVEEMAKVLTIALKLEVPAETNNSATTWAKGYVQAAINAGLLDSKLNFQSNASRELLVGAAYAIDQAQSLKVASYDVTEAGKVVTFKMSDGESVKVTLDKALEANKETEVKFTYKDREFTEKVVYKTTGAQAVSSASASNLKEVVVKFDGTVDEASAENENNYIIENSANSDGKTIESATLSDDKTTVTLLLADRTSSFLPGQVENVLPSQRETFVQVNNVKNADSTKTITQRVAFTPLDVTVPEVKEVTALGTKAFKIEFSEPIVNTNLTSSNFRIDDKNIAASLTYVYPNTIIAETNLTEGEHTLRVSNVKDFSGLTVVPVEKTFKATADTAAPKVVSAKTNDLQKVVVEFDEPVKAVSGAYANVSSVKPVKTEISGNKVTLTFGEKALSYTDNKIFLTGVRDYSGNTGNVEHDVTSTLDSTRPTVVTSKFYQEGVSGNYIAEVQFSKALAVSSIQDRSNYVLKNDDGKVPSANGLNADGNPIRTPEFVTGSGNKIVKINFGSNLKDDNYSLTVSGLRDTAYAANVLLPVTINLSVKDAAYGEVVRAYTDSNSVTDGREVYIQFNKALATSGEGNALKAEKYVIQRGTGAAATYYQLTPNDSDVELISADTIRVTKRNSNFSLQVNDKIVVSYVADTTGKYLDNGNYNYSGSTGVNRYVLDKEIVGRNDAIAVAPASVEATSGTELKLEFNTPLSNAYARDFTATSVTYGTYNPSDAVLSANGKTLTLKFEGTSKLPLAFTDLKLSTVNGTTYTQDTYGNLVKIATPVNVKNSIKPEWDGVLPTITRVSDSSNSYTVVLRTTKDVKDNSALSYPSTNLFKVVLGNSATTVEKVEISGNVITLTVTATTPAAVSTNVYNVVFSGNSGKWVTDTVGNNELEKFEVAK
ncbi:S-layer homology domain-containing protein [Paenibacillus pabuli]|uniref:S-layer homology domain-containing protein n=1 Tax=Paenibacillus pabuli TaxID=1472 RepID=UPI000784B984|nr:S-layer homology domain-containing protein [Paenibacillus pabuli]MEC0129240.1 S-layer homology domain-containing protein [Paenibacillus pabuli]